MALAPVVREFLPLLDKTGQQVRAIVLVPTLSGVDSEPLVGEVEQISGSGSYIVRLAHRLGGTVRQPDEVAGALARRPHLARVVAERRQREQEHVEAAQRAENRARGPARQRHRAAKQARHEGRLDEARELLVSLIADFPTNQEIRSVLDRVRWQAHHLSVAPAEEALSDVSRRPYRDNPEAAVGRLAAVDMYELPDELARRIFGVWSNNCSKLVRQAGMHEPRRYSPATSRGVLIARRTPEGPYQVVSAPGLAWLAGRRGSEGPAASSTPRVPFKSGKDNRVYLIEQVLGQPPG